jgi:glycosyltransferase involved in cell wall biosynthesis
LGNNHCQIALVSFPMASNTHKIFLKNLINIVEPNVKKLFVISNLSINEYKQKVNIIDLGINLHYRSKTNWVLLSNLLQAIKIIFIQIKICFILIRIRHKIDIVFFYVGGVNLLLPTVFSKLISKKVISSALGLASKSYNGAGKKALSNVFAQIEKAIFYLSDYIIVESPKAVGSLNLEKYQTKIFPYGARYIDTNIFRFKDKCRHPLLIGYIGRLEEEKGLSNLIEAIPLVLNNKDDIKFLFCGDGPLFNKIKYDVKKGNLEPFIDVVGWISHNQVPEYLHKISLLILPSFSEGLPTIILEAMACGTPVLTTPVGGICDVIKDGKTGFLLENNSPECIAESVLKILNMPDTELEQVSENARKFVENEFTFENVVKRWREILDSI